MKKLTKQVAKSINKQILLAKLFEEIGEYIDAYFSMKTRLITDELIENEINEFADLKMRVDLLYESGYYDKEYVKQRIKMKLDKLEEKYEQIR